MLELDSNTGNFGKINVLERTLSPKCFPSQLDIFAAQPRRTGIAMLIFLQLVISWEIISSYNFIMSFQLREHVRLWGLGETLSLLLIPLLPKDISP